MLSVTGIICRFLNIRIASDRGNFSQVNTAIYPNMGHSLICLLSLAWLSMAGMALDSCTFHMKPNYLIVDRDLLSLRAPQGNASLSKNTRRDLHRHLHPFALGGFCSFDSRFEQEGRARLTTEAMPHGIFQQVMPRCASTLLNLKCFIYL